MKSFFKTLFATFLALVLFTVVVVLLGIAVVAGLVRLGAKQEPKIADGSFLVVDLSVNLTDTPVSFESTPAVIKRLTRDNVDKVSLRTLLDAIHAAAGDSKIGGIFLHGSFTVDGYGSGFAAIKEAREALLDFRKSSKKPVIAYLVEPTTRDYYLASAADTVYMQPFGEMHVPGLATTPIFFKGALDKYGIGMEVVRHGKYKSAVEPFLTDKMSPENREQTQKLLDDLWSQFKTDVAASRHLTPEAIQTLVDKEGVITPEGAKAGGLIDDAAYLPDLIEKLRDKVGADPDANKHTFRQVDLATYVQKTNLKPEAVEGTLAEAARVTDNNPRLAIVYAEGEIVDGEGAAGTVGGERYARVLRKLRQDANVKGILLRVNSPGGSVLGSELIQHELVLARAAGKPVVISMGTLAASGGYWISTAADRVFAEPNTITGSIGVFGLLPNVQKLANDNGVTFDEVRTGKYAALQTASRPKTPEELAALQNLVEADYKRFVDKVAEARQLPAERVDEIGQGRVWSGTEALELKLVNELGGLEKAIAYARTKAGLAEGSKIVEFPAPKEVGEELSDLFATDKRPEARVGGVDVLQVLGIGPKAGPLGQSLRDVQSDLGVLSRADDATTVYARLPFDLRVR